MIIEDLRRSRRVRIRRIHEWLNSTEGSISEGAAHAFVCVAALIEMMLVEEGVEGSMEGLDLRL